MQCHIHYSFLLHKEFVVVEEVVVVALAHNKSRKQRVQPIIIRDHRLYNQ